MGFSVSGNQVKVDAKFQTSTGGGSDANANNFKKIWAGAT